MKTCNVCRPDLNAWVPVDDIKNPTCPKCGRKLNVPTKKKPSTYHTAVENGIKEFDKNVNYDEAELNCAWGKDDCISFLRSFASTIRDAVLDEVREKVIGVDEELDFVRDVGVKKLMQPMVDERNRVREKQRHQLEAMRKEGV